MSPKIHFFAIFVFFLGIQVNLSSQVYAFFDFSTFNKFPKLEYDFYRDSCRDAEKVVWDMMKNIVAEHENAPAQLLRLMFHDCFIQGCDASVLLTGMANRSSERQAIPNKTLKGFEFVEEIKENLETDCPGLVSCADILVLATRDAIVLSGGPYYPIMTGRKDSLRSYFSEALAEIPRPDANISESLRLFAARGFNDRETAALLGGHNIGRIGCQFIQPRLQASNAAMPMDFLLETRRKCLVANNSVGNRAVPLMSRHVTEGMFYQGLSSSNSSGGGFDSHYYRSLIRGRGLLVADQELMANANTAKAVLDYANDMVSFRTEFAKVMLKLSNLNVLVGSAGEVRRKFSAQNSN